MEERMKDQFKKLFCLFFGHRADLNCEYNNVQYCLRCHDRKDNPYSGCGYWTDWEMFGLIIYPIKKIQWLVSGICYTINKKVRYILHKKEDEDELPF